MIIHKVFFFRLTLMQIGLKLFPYSLKTGPVYVKVRALELELVESFQPN